MRQHNPPHPGEFIQSVFLDELGISIRKLAEHLEVSPPTVSRLIRGESSVTPEMAIKLSQVLGRTPESWLTMQDNYNLWKAQKKMKGVSLTPLFAPQMVLSVEG